MSKTNDTFQYDTAQNSVYAGEKTVNAQGIPEIWPGWNIVRLIGAGSFGKVYEIHRQNGDWTEKAAMKLIRIPSNPIELEQLRMDGIGDEDTEQYLKKHVEEIRSEIGLMQRFVGNSNIVSYEDYLIQKHASGIGWDILIRMELLNTLSDYMQTHPFTEEDVIRLGTDIAQALIICHGAGIIHRDIKPQNIFVNDHGFFKLGDFGISRFQPGAGSVMSFKGTLSYMAPETFALRGTDGRSDIYSLALVLYRILNEWKEPFLGTESRYSPEQRDEAQRRRLKGSPLPPPLHGSPALQRVLATALAADPAARFQTAAQFREALLNVSVLNRLSGSEREARNNTGRTGAVFQPGTGFTSGGSGTGSAGVTGTGAGRQKETRVIWQNVNEGRRDPNRDHSQNRRQTVNSNQLSVQPGYAVTSQQTPGTGGAGGIQNPVNKNGNRGKSSRKVLIAILLGAAALLLIFGGMSMLGNGRKGATETAKDERAQADREPEETLSAENEDSARDPAAPDQEQIALQEKSANDATADMQGFGESSPADIGSEEDSRPYDAGEDANAETYSGDDTSNLIDQPQVVDDLDTEVAFGDESLEKAVVNAMNITDHAITKREAQGMRKLDLTGTGKSEGDLISDLTGLEDFSNLEELLMAENRISNLSPIASLTGLKILHLESNYISDLSPLSNLTKLEKLDLYQNVVSDISDIQSLTKLTMLDLRENAVHDISALENMEGMKELYLSDNRIDEVSSVHNMHQLTYLSLNNNPIDDISAVGDLNELRTLCLSGCSQLKIIRVLEGLSALNYLDLRDSGVSSNDSTIRKLKKRDGFKLKQ